jgi:hypothetical protein
MTSKEFVIWLKGFTEGVHEFAITPKQWDYLKEKLEEVKDEERIGTPIGEGGWGIPNTTPNWQWPHYPNPLDNPYKITCTPGTTNIGTITTTPGVSSITYANPPGTSTQWNPSGSAWSYTNSTDGKIF